MRGTIRSPEPPFDVTLRGLTQSALPRSLKQPYQCADLNLQTLISSRIGSSKLSFNVAPNSLLPLCPANPFFQKAEPTGAPTASSSKVAQKSPYNTRLWPGKASLHAERERR